MAEETLEISINPQYQNLVPELTKQEYDDLKESIRNQGLLIPIVVNKQNIILDGHHRFRICQELGIKADHVVKEFENQFYEQLFIIDCNLKRRTLNDFQRVELALKRKPILEQLAKDRQRQGGSEKVPQIFAEALEVNETLGKVADVSKETVRKVEMLLKEADEKTIKNLRNKKKKLTISKAFKFWDNKKKREQAASEAKASNQDPKTERYELIQGDIIEMGENISDNSVDLIFTDPPYLENNLGVYDALAELAQRVLKPGGSLVTFVGHHIIPEVLPKLNSLEYFWLLVVRHTGGSKRLHGFSIHAKYKPLLWFYKYNGKPKPTMWDEIEDVIDSEPPNKELHDWEQSPKEAEYVIKILTVEGSRVLDPFMGSGTTGIASLNLNRYFIGVELDNNRFNVAKSRLEKFTNAILS